MLGWGEMLRGRLLREEGEEGKAELQQRKCMYAAVGGGGRSE